MKYENFCIVIIFLLFIAFGAAHAQDASVSRGGGLFADGGFTPFVSNINVKAADNRVTITWKDIENLSTVKYRVYRSLRELFPENLRSAQRIGDFAPGAQMAVDTIRNNGSYYYAVVTVNRVGVEVPVLIPSDNKITIPVVISSIEEFIDFVMVKSLRASVVENGIELRFNTEKNIRTTVFRSTHPIFSADDLLSATQITNIALGVQRYVDSAIAGIPYYYAAFDYNIIKTGYYIFSEISGQKFIEPGENSLRRAIAIPLEAVVSGAGDADADAEAGTIARASQRDNFLPTLMLDQALSSGVSFADESTVIPDKTIFQAKTTENLKTIIQRFTIPSAKPMLPVILESEGRTNVAEIPLEEQILIEIANGNFLNAVYEPAIRQLENLLDMNITADVEFRARFYYAQSLYFAGNLRAAALQFLIIRKENPFIVRPWFEWVLDVLARYPTSSPSAMPDLYSHYSYGTLWASN